MCSNPANYFERDMDKEMEEHKDAVIYTSSFPYDKSVCRHMVVFNACDLKTKGGRLIDFMAFYNYYEEPADQYKEINKELLDRWMIESLGNRKGLPGYKGYFILVNAADKYKEAERYTSDQWCQLQGYKVDESI